MSLSGKGRLLAATLTAASSMLLFTACGAAEEPAAPTGTGGQDAFAAYRACLQDNGVTLPSANPSRMPGGVRPTDRPTGRPTDLPGSRPTARPSGAPAAAGQGFPGMGRPDGVDEAAWQKALQACGSLRPSGGPGGGGGRGPGAPDGRPDDGRDTAYRTCLRNRGIDPDQIATTGTATRQALTACAPVSPSPAG